MSQLVEKTYKPAVAGHKKHKRPFSKAVLKQVGEGGERNMPTLFAALYAENIKQIKATAGNKENSVKSCLRNSSRTRPLRPLGSRMANTMNIIFEDAELKLDSSFDKLLKGPRRELERTPFWIRFRGWKDFNVAVSPRRVNFQPVKFEAEPRSRLWDWQKKSPQSPLLSSPCDLSDPPWETRKKTAKRTFNSKRRRRRAIAKEEKDLSDSEDDQPLMFLRVRSKPFQMRTRVRERTKKGHVEPSVSPVWINEPELHEEVSSDHCSKQTCASDVPGVSEEENPVFLNSSVKRTTQSREVKEARESGFMQARLSSEETQGTRESGQSIEVRGITEQTRLCTEGKKSRVLRARKSEESLTKSGLVQKGLCTEGQYSRVLRIRKSEEVPRLTRSRFVRTSMEGPEPRVLQPRKSEDGPRLTRTGFLQTSLCSERQNGQDSRVSQTRKSEEFSGLTKSEFVQSRQSSRVQKTHCSAEDEEQCVKSEDNCDTQHDKVIFISSESDEDSQSLRRLSRQLQVVLTPARFSYSSREEESVDSTDMFHSGEDDVPLKEEGNAAEDEKYSPQKQFCKEEIYASALGNVSNSSDFVEESPSPVGLCRRWTNRTSSARLLHKSVDTALNTRRKTCNRRRSRHTISVGQMGTVTSEVTANDMNSREVLKESEFKQIQSVGALDSSRLTRPNRRRSRHVVSMGQRTLLLDRTANDTNLEQVLEESESEQMQADDAVDSRPVSYHRRRSRLTVLPELYPSNTSLEHHLDDCESEEMHPVSVSRLDMSLMHRSVSNRTVFPLSRISALEEKSLGFRDVFVNSSLSILRDVSTVASDNSKSSIGNDEVLDEVEPVITARDVVLQRCRQTEPLPFNEAFPDWCLEKCKKIGEGVYGEVFSLERPNVAPSVLKIIPIEGELQINGEPQKTYEEILSEIVIAMELSELRNGTDFCTSGFSELIRCWCVQGKYPSRLLSLWFEFDKEKGSENESPDVFSDEQLFIVLELANAGTDLESYVLNSAEQALAVFVQVTNSLAVAEGALEFEHRDLHWGNILIKPTTEKTMRFVLYGEECHVPTKGVQVTIIDFTLSRMTYDGCSIYNDLAQDPSLFTSYGDFQFEVYRLMKSTVQNDWQLFRPYTNVVWLRYVLDKMETGVHYRRKNSKVHKTSLSELRRLKKGILDMACSIAVMKSNLV